MSWPLAKLETVSEFIRNGASIKQSSDAAGLPITRIETIADRAVNLDKCGYADVSEGEYLNYRLCNGDILISHINSEKHLAKCAIFESDRRDIVHGMNLLCLRPRCEVVFPKYLFHYLSSPVFLRLIPAITKKSVNQASFTVTAFKDLEIPLPPLSEQKRIAAILDKADAIRRKRQQAIQLADDFLRAVFLDMFGDPVTNPKGWETKALADVCKKITDGTHHSPPIVDAGVPYITAKHLKKTGLQFFNDPWFISEEDHRAIYSRCAPEKNDVLYIKDGATTGLAAINEYDFEFSMLSSLALLKPCREKILPEYLTVFLNHPITKKVIIANMAGAAITRLTLAKIKSVRIPVPPIEMQQKFTDIYVKVREATMKITSGVDASVEAFEAISQRAFAGQL